MPVILTVILIISTYIAIRLLEIAVQHAKGKTTAEFAVTVFAIVGLFITVVASTILLFSGQINRIVLGP